MRDSAGVFMVGTLNKESRAIVRGVLKFGMKECLDHAAYIARERSIGKESEDLAAAANQLEILSRDFED